MRLFALLLALVLTSTATNAYSQTDAPKPIRALLIAGGCCHDYARQQEALCKGIQSRANVKVDVYWTDNSTTAPVLPLYSKLNWAEEYDVIIHDECAADIKDPALVNRIIQTHQRIPAVHLHCAMHSFRTGGEAWFKHLGLQSNSHGPQEPIEINFVDTKHPITATLGNWTTIREELYNNVKLYDAHPIARGKQTVGNGANQRIDEAIVVWTNEAQGARSFSTTLGHNSETVEDPRYLELVTRGLLWACNKLNTEYLSPYKGENKVTFVDKASVQSPETVMLAKIPENATLAKITASSTQSGNDPYRAFDGKNDTRWCADGDAYPQWLQVEFQQPHVMQEIQIAWEFGDRQYNYRVEGSIDGREWSMLLDKSKNNDRRQAAEKLLESPAVKFIRITGISGNPGSWCSIREVKLNGVGVGAVWPADPKSDAGKFAPVQSDPYTKRGNTVPRIEKLTAEQEAEILKDVKVADGFEATVFASPPAVNYPVFVAAAVDGTLYVSSDGNGSLGRNPDRGRIIRLRDTDGDGRADETKVFCDVDAPRGLVWDNDRLYVMHPPNLSEFIDHDGDGIADEQRTLVKNLAFDYDKRPADHTTNGLSIGVDGWLYIAGGDFGFIDAQGTDGRKLTHRGGGVIRVRPDGTGLEIYSTGTRNILEVAISPQMEMFARDNTNDGGGWDVRLHHFTGMDDHGYPRLYKNFNDECVQPLADYGGGSGCGAVFIDEPGFGKWNNAPFTADWGTGSLYRHSVVPQGATYQEVAKPESFIRMTRPTDADVDGNSRVYCASWRGATFDWNGTDVGYIVCVKPKGFVPAALPSFANAEDSALAALLKDSSYRRRMEAQRELMRRGNSAYQQLWNSGLAARADLRNLVDRLQTIASDSECVDALASSDPLVVHTAIRCLAKRNAYKACFDALDSNSGDSKGILRALAMMHEPAVVDGLIARLSKSTTAENRKLILGALCRLHYREGDWKGDSWGTRPDTRGPYYQPESWSETERIAGRLQQEFDSSSSEDAAALMEVMAKNRIQSNDSLARMLQLAKTNRSLMKTAIAQLAASSQIPTDAVNLLVRASSDNELTVETISDAVVALAKVGSAEAFDAMLDALAFLNNAKDAEADLRRARDAFLSSPRLESQLSSIVRAAKNSKDGNGLWADAALLFIASGKNISPENREAAKKLVEDSWSDVSRRERLIESAIASNNHFLDEQILSVREDKNEAIAQLAKSAIDRLKIQTAKSDQTPKVGTVKIEQAIAQAVSRRGDVNVGQQIFTRANCVACHTVRQDEVQKGPYLGSIAKTYKRPDLAVAVLEPSKTIAQGFTTNIILTADGAVLTGFVTNELSDSVTIRDQQGKEFTLKKDEIESRKTSPNSVMPAGVMNDYSVFELASLLDYLESLAAQSSDSSK